MIDICVALRDPAPSNLRGNNLRSEGRWERQALEALSVNPEVSNLYTSGYEWSSGCGNYRGLISSATAGRCVLVTQDWNASVASQYNYKACMINIFSGLWPFQIDEFRQINRNIYSDKIMFTLGFSVFYRSSDMINHMLKFIDSTDNIHYLPVPGAPYISNEDHFNRDQILWAGRRIFFSELYDTEAIHWALGRLNKDEKLKLCILTGFFPNEIREYRNGIEYYDVQEEINSLFWRQEPLQPYVHLRPRVEINYAVGWDTALAKYDASKLMAYYGKHFGGPPIEASMHGVPFVASHEGNGALADCPNYVTCHSEKEACTIFDRLMDDQDYYNKIANSYRKFTSETYTYDKFNENLIALLKQKELI